MDNYFYYQMIRKHIIQFCNVFNNVKIAKLNADGSVQKQIQVPLKLSSKQKFYYWCFHGKNELKMFPMMAVNFTGMQPNFPERGFNSNNIKLRDIESQHYSYPVPWDYSFDLYIAANYFIEVDQILEQILPWFTPYIMINIEIPEINNNLDVKITCDTVSQDKTVEIPEDGYRAINWTLSFTAKGYLMRPVNDSNIIEKIHLNYINNNETLEQTEIDEDGITIINYEDLHLIDE